MDTPAQVSMAAEDLPQGAEHILFFYESHGSAGHELRLTTERDRKMLEDDPPLEFVGDGIRFEKTASSEAKYRVEVVTGCCPVVHALVKKVKTLEEGRTMWLKLLAFETGQGPFIVTGTNAASKPVGRFDPPHSLDSDDEENLRAALEKIRKEMYAPIVAALVDTEGCVVESYLIRPVNDAPDWYDSAGTKT